MNRVTILAGVLALAIAPLPSLAQSKSKGASEFSPGDQMRDSGKTTKGASEYTPSDQRKDAGSKTGKGASEYTPGDKKNDARKK